MLKVALTSFVLILRLVLSALLLFVIDFPCASVANGDFMTCCSEGMGCGENAGDLAAAKDCCAQKGTSDTPLSQVGVDSDYSKSPDLYMANLIWIGSAPETFPCQYQSVWSRKILKIPLNEVYKLTCTYLI